jgi:hypothetical protein
VRLWRWSFGRVKAYTVAAGAERRRAGAEKKLISLRPL